MKFKVEVVLDVYFHKKVENGGCFVFLKMLKFICGKKYLQR